MNLSEKSLDIIGRDNPYPFIKGCDIYVQTSIKEGWGLTVQEAKVLHKPIVTTNAGVMKEQISNGINGIVIDNIDCPISALGGAIDYLLTHEHIRKQFSEALTAGTIDGQQDLAVLYNAIEGENSQNRVTNSHAV